MGWFFSNLHIHKTAEFDMDAFRAALVDRLGASGYLPMDDPKAADLSLSIYDPGGRWVSVCSDGLDFFTEDSILAISEPLSEQFSADVLTVSCFDSDCLLLNRINKKLDISAWVKIGTYPGLKARSMPTQWKDLVSDAAQWKAVLRRKYSFAENALDELEPLLGLSPGQGRFCDELIADQFGKCVQSFYFKLPESASKPEPPKLSLFQPSLMPCEIGKDQCCFAINTGEKTRGLAIAFSGSYVENEDIRFRHVRLECSLDQRHRKTIPLSLEKIQTAAGQWIYYTELPHFPIREGVKDGLGWRKAMDEGMKRAFGVRFTPEGDPRKLLDITVHFIPLKNPEGQCGWCVWLYNGSKRAFVEEYNHRWGEIIGRHPTAGGVRLLNIDDYDMDD